VSNEITLTLTIIYL